MATATAEPSAAPEDEQKGLKANAIGFVDALVIGLASTALPTRSPRSSARSSSSGRAEVALVAERPVQGLLDLAAEHDARLIVVGTHGESPLRGAILGSVPHKLLQLSGTPVLVVPSRRPTDGR